VDKEQAITIAEEFTKRVVKELSPMQVLLFGSYMNGNYHERSDIDIAVIFDKYPGDWWEGATRLESICWDMKNTDIEPHLMELSDDDQMDFAHRVIKTGKVLYQKK